MGNQWSDDCSEEFGKRFGLSPRGFLPVACVARLPTDGAFEALERLADNLPTRNRSGTLRAAVDGLDAAASSRRISADDVASLNVPQLRRAYVLCAMLTHAYVHAAGPRWAVLSGADGDAADDAAAAKPAAGYGECAAAGPAADSESPAAEGGAPLPSVPAALARPLVLVCARIGLPPVLTAAGSDLWNWRLLDESQPFGLDNLTTITSMTGTATEAGFHMLPCAMHGVIAPLVTRLYRAPRADDAALGAFLHELAAALVQCKALFKTVGTRVDRAVFYHVQRPLLGGFYPDGVTLAGAADITLPTDWIRAPKGPSAGQSTMFILIDGLLGVEHAVGAADFQTEMLSYMPPKHRAMVLAFRDEMLDGGRNSARARIERLDAAAEDGDAAAVESGRALREGFTACTAALASLRRFHLGVATRYLTKTKTGTGSSTFRTLLKECIDGTERIALEKK